MYIFKYESGELRQAPENFDINNPNMVVLEKVVEVYQVNRSFTKQTKLVSVKDNAASEASGTKKRGRPPRKEAML